LIRYGGNEVLGAYLSTSNIISKTKAYCRLPLIQTRLTRSCRRLIFGTLYGVALQVWHSTFGGPCGEKLNSIQFNVADLFHACWDYLYSMNSLWERKPIMLYDRWRTCGEPKILAVANGGGVGSVRVGSKFSFALVPITFLLPTSSPKEAFVHAIGVQGIVMVLAAVWLVVQLR
jgi:hypothetical protein